MVLQMPHKLRQKQHQSTKHRVISYLKWNRRKIDSNRIVHSWENALLFQARSADRASQGQLNESERLRAQFKLGSGTGGAFTIPFAHSSFPARYRWRPRVSRVSTESTERCQVKSKAIIKTDKYERKTVPLRARSGLTTNLEQPSRVKELSTRGGAKGFDTLGTRLDKQYGDQRERSSRFRKYF